MGFFLGSQVFSPHPQGQPLLILFTCLVFITVHILDQIVQLLENTIENEQALETLIYIPLLETNPNYNCFKALKVLGLIARCWGSLQNLKEKKREADQSNASLKTPTYGIMKP